MVSTVTNPNQGLDFITLGKAALKNIRMLMSPSVWKATHRINSFQRQRLQSILDEITKHPTDYRIHFILAEYYFSIGRIIPAIAECRTSIGLGNKSPEVYLLLAEAYVAVGCGSFAEDLFTRGLLPAEYLRNLQREYGTDTDGLLKLPPFIYQRLQAIGTRVKKAIPDPHVRILDVGGGEGQLCLFMPNARYILAEPTINGIADQLSAFPEKFFDAVVACHVLEHIEEIEKENFLEALCSLAKNCVILLEPVNSDGYAARADALIYRITRALWAKEHLDCKLPTLEMLRDFASRHGLECNVMPNGDRAAVFWMVFASHYANVAGKTNELQEIVPFSNRYLTESLSNPNQPNDYLVEFYVDKSSAAKL